MPLCDQSGSPPRQRDQRAWCVRDSPILLRRASLTEEAYNALKWRILTHDLRPGGLFTEEDLSRLSGFGRSPVHQAVHRLQYDGLVEILPRKGIVVRAFSGRDINQLIEVRLPIEMEMARLAALRATTEQLNALRVRLAEGRST